MGWRPTSSTRTSSWPPASRDPSGSGRPGSRRKETTVYRTEDVLATLGMIRQHKLDVRTVTMGVDLQPCASPDLPSLCERIRDRLLSYAGRLRAVCREVEGRYGIPIVNRRIAVSPIASVAAAHTAEGYLAVAATLDAVAAEGQGDPGGGVSPPGPKGGADGGPGAIQ